MAQLRAAPADRVRRLPAAIVLLFVSAMAIPAAAAGPVRLGELKLMLWYQETGRLSENIAPPRNFTLWNTCIGEGDAKEIANDVIFTAEVQTSGEQNVTQPITLTATNARGVILAPRIVKAVLTSASGRATLPLLVSDIGCAAGTVTFSARLGTQSKSITLKFDGGE